MVCTCAAARQRCSHAVLGCRAMARPCMHAASARGHACMLPQHAGCNAAAICSCVLPALCCCCTSTSACRPQQSQLHAVSARAARTTLPAHNVLTRSSIHPTDQHLPGACSHTADTLKHTAPARPLTGMTSKGRMPRRQRATRAMLSRSLPISLCTSQCCTLRMTCAPWPQPPGCDSRCCSRAGLRVAACTCGGRWQRVAGSAECLLA
jgi:hypothetical protein